MRFVLPGVEGALLGGLLDGIGPAGPTSPRSVFGEPRTPSPTEAAELYAAGILERPEGGRVVPTAAFRKVSEVLLDPGTALTIRAWGADDICAETTALFPRSVSSGRGVILNQEGTAFHLRAWVEPEHVLDLAAGFLPPGPPDARPITLDAHLHSSSAATLLALSDLARGLPDLDLSEDGPAGFLSSDIYGYLAGRWGLTGFEHLISYVAHAGYAPRPPSVLEVDRALEELAEAEVLRRTAEGGFALSRAVAPIASLTPGLIPGFQWQRMTQGGPDEVLLSNRTFLFGNDYLILCLAPTVSRHIHISSPTRSEVIGFLSSELTHPVVKSSPATEEARRDGEPATAPTSEPAPEPAPEPEPRLRFCTRCGKGLKPRAQYCTGCGTEARRG